MNYLTLQEIQSELTNMLKYLTDLLEDNGINYFVSSGTCLGAIRHGGFIPWDNDIDIFMFREDYEKFLALKLDAPFYILSPKNEDVVFPFAKFCNSDYALTENVIRGKYSKYNLFIDVFPLDYLPEDKKERAKVLRRKQKLKNEILLAYFKGATFIKKIVKNVYSFFYTRNRLAELKQKLDKLGCPEKTSHIMDLSWGLTPLRTEFFEGFEYKDFDGVKVRVPIKWHEYLTCIYGDYMKLPPESKRYSHDLNVYKTKDEK